MEIRREQKSAGNSRQNQSQIRQLPHPIAILDYDAVIFHLDGFNSLQTGPNQLFFCLFVFIAREQESMRGDYVFSPAFSTLKCKPPEGRGYVCLVHC